MSEKLELEQGLSAARLQSRIRIGSVLLLASVLIPYEVINGTPQFVWQVWGELSVAAQIASLSLTWAGLTLLAVGHWVKSPLDQALACFACFAGVLVVGKFGGDASAWDTMSVPNALGDRPALLLLPFACSGAGAALAGRGQEQAKRAKVLLWLGLASNVPLYFVPYHGSLPIVGVLELLVLSASADDVRFALGYGMIAFTALIPALVGGAAALMALRPPRRELIVPPLLMTFALPLMLCLFVAREFFLTLGNSSVLSSALGLMPLIAGLGIAAAALEVISTGGRPSTKALSFAGACLLLVSATMAFLSQKPEKGVAWNLKESSVEADKLFGERLHEWNVMRRSWGVSSKAREEASAKDYVRVRKSGTDLVKDATKVAPAVSRALSDLVFETRDLDLAGRRWFRLIHELNATSQRAGLPYYVDPTVDVIHKEGGVSLLFDLQSYRIESVVPHLVHGRKYATLHVRALGNKRRNHSLLGFSRDIQPFAVVALDVLEPYVEKLTRWAQSEPPTCFERDLNVYPEFEFCGAQLASVSTKQEDLLRLSIALTDRHELQHQVDGPQLPIASRVNDRMGPYFSWARDDVNRELSAHLAEITAKEGSPHLALLQVFGNAYSGGRRGKYTLASIMVFELLLGRELEAAGGSDRKASNDAILAAYKELAVLPADALRKRARSAWEDAYGSDLE